PSRRELPEERLELLDYGFYADADRVEHGPDVDALGQRRVLERDMDSETRLYVHLGVRSIEDDSSKQRTQFQGARRKRRVDEAVRFVVSCSTEPVARGAEHPVLVQVRQALEDHEPVVVGTVNSVVRLQSLYRCHEVRSHALKLPKVRPELSTASVDRKVSIASETRRQLAAVEDRELKGELVEGRRRIVETVTNDRSPLGSRVPQAIDPIDVHSA